MDTFDVSYFLHKPIRTRQLLLLVALDEHRNIRRAAQSLHMTQPGASKQLKELEDLLEVSLFNRMTRGMEPTAFGKVMIRYAQLTLSNLAAAQGDIKTLKSGKLGRVRVGAIPTPAIKLLPHTIAHLAKTTPGLRISTETALTSDLIEKLNNGSLDLAIGHFNESGHTSSFTCIPLRREARLEVVVRNDHPLANKMGLILKDTSDFPWILPADGTAFRRFINGIFYSSAMEPPTIGVEAFDALMIVKLLQLSEFVTFMEHEAATFYSGMNAIRILDVKYERPVTVNTFGIAYRSDRELSAGAQLFLKTLIEDATTLGMYPGD
jgi:DNA-binding transcriptional LysR family regulator